MSARRGKAARKGSAEWARRLEAKAERNARHRMVTTNVFAQLGGNVRLARWYALRGQWYRGIGK